MKLAGLILAGGRSTRFGTEKSMALLGGSPLIGHVLGLLMPDCENIAVSAPAGSGTQTWAASRGLAVLSDTLNMAPGSLNGIHAGLSWASGLGVTHLAILACDAPRLPPRIVRSLALGLGRAVGAVAVDASGATHTLCSLWEVSLRKALEAELRKDRYPPIRVVQEKLGFAHVQFGTIFSNVNTPADLERLN